MGQTKEYFGSERDHNFDEDEWKYLKGQEAEEQIEFCERLEKDIHGKFSLIVLEGDWLLINSVDVYTPRATSNNPDELISYLRIMQIYKFEIHI